MLPIDWLLYQEPMTLTLYVRSEKVWLNLVLHTHTHTRTLSPRQCVCVYVCVATLLTLLPPPPTLLPPVWPPPLHSIWVTCTHTVCRGLWPQAWPFTTTGSVASHPQTQTTGMWLNSGISKPRASYLFPASSSLSTPCLATQSKARLSLINAHKKACLSLHSFTKWSLITWC